MNDAIVSSRTRSLVITLSALSLVATVVALVWGRKLSPRPISPHDSYGRGPLNTRVFVESLSDLGISYRREVDTSRLVGSTDPVVFLAPDDTSISVDGRTWDLGDIVRQRAEARRSTVLVLPKWRLDFFGHADALSLGTVERFLEAGDVDEALTVARVGDPDDEPAVRALTGEAAAGRHVEVPMPQVLAGGVPVQGIADGALVASDADGRVFVVADADLVANFTVGRQQNADVLVGVLRSIGARHVVVDETFHGRTEPKRLAEALGEWPGVLVLIHGALLVLASMLAGRLRFGPARVEAAPYGRGPREAIAVAADVLTLGRSPIRLVRRYVELVVRDTHRRTRSRDDGGAFTTTQAAQRLDRLDEARGREGEAQALLLRANRMGRAKSAREDLAIALTLARDAHAYRRRKLGHRAGGEKT